LDAARFFAAAGVVWVHTVASQPFLSLGALGTFGVPFYICVALFVMRRALDRDRSLSLHQYYWQRFSRLYLPFLAWTAIYFAAIALKHRVLGVNTRLFLELPTLLTGPVYQLWFLPYLCIITVPAAIAYRVTIAFPRYAPAVALGSAAIGTVWAFWPRPDWLNYLPDHELFCLLAWKATPSAFCGFAMAHFVSRMPRNPQTMSGLAAIGFFLTWATIGNQIIYGYNRLDRTLSGIGWFLMAFAPFSGRIFKWFGTLGKHSYGIYLGHVLFVEGLQTIADLAHLPNTPILDIAVFVLAMVGSTLLAIAAGYNRWTALLMGEALPKPTAKKTRTAKPEMVSQSTLVQVA
jgi:surface polysaccharide O-acyltransferase-like enzyme